MINNVTSASNIKTKGVDKNDRSQSGAQKNIAPGKSTSNTTVEISSEAKKLSATAKNMILEPTLNDVKIAEIKQSIANGEYKISAEDIAKKILNDL